MVWKEIALLRNIRKLADEKCTIQDLLCDSETYDSSLYQSSADSRHKSTRAIIRRRVAKRSLHDVECSTDITTDLEPDEPNLKRVSVHPEDAIEILKDGEASPTLPQARRATADRSSNINATSVPLEDNSMWQTIDSTRSTSALNACSTRVGGLMYAEKTFSDQTQVLSPIPVPLSAIKTLKNVVRRSLAEVDLHAVMKESGGGDKTVRDKTFPNNLQYRSLITTPIDHSEVEDGRLSSVPSGGVGEEILPVSFSPQSTKDQIVCGEKAVGNSFLTHSESKSGLVEREISDEILVRGEVDDQTFPVNNPDRSLALAAASEVGSQTNPVNERNRSAALTTTSEMCNQTFSFNKPNRSATLTTASEMHNQTCSVSKQNRSPAVTTTSEMHSKTFSGNKRNRSPALTTASEMHSKTFSVNKRNRSPALTTASEMHSKTFPVNKRDRSSTGGVDGQAFLVPVKSPGVLHTPRSKLSKKSEEGGVIFSIRSRTKSSLSSSHLVDSVHAEVSSQHAGGRTVSTRGSSFGASMVSGFVDESSGNTYVTDWVDQAGQQDFDPDSSLSEGLKSSIAVAVSVAMSETLDDASENPAKNEGTENSLDYENEALGQDTTTTTNISLREGNCSETHTYTEHDNSGYCAETDNSETNNYEDTKRQSEDNSQTNNLRDDNSQTDATVSDDDFVTDNSMPRDDINGASHQTFSDNSLQNNMNNSNSSRRRRRSLGKKIAISLRQRTPSPGFSEVKVEKKKKKSRLSEFDASLPSLAGAPVHYAEITTNQRTPRQTRKKYMTLGGQKLYSSPQLVKPLVTPRSKELGLRRSTRTKLGVLRGYAGERPIYEKDKTTGAFVIVGIEKTNPEDDFIIQHEMAQAEKELQRKKTRAKKRKKKKTDVSLHVSFADASFSDGSVTVCDEKTEKNIHKVITSNRCEIYYDLAGNPADDDAPVKVSKRIQDEAMSCGEIILAGLAEKPDSFLRGYNVMFNVQKGAVLLQINEGKKKVLKEHGCFNIPSGNSYKLKNLRKTTAELFFTTQRNR